MIPESLHAREAEAARIQEQRGIVGSGCETARCGLCDLPIAEGAAVAEVDDEVCHLGCAEAGEAVYGGWDDEESAS